jgi:hypothetical protein
VIKWESVNKAHDPVILAICVQRATIEYGALTQFRV